MALFVFAAVIASASGRDSRVVHRCFAIVFYLAALSVLGAAIYRFWSDYPMSLGLGGAM